MIWNILLWQINQKKNPKMLWFNYKIGLLEIPPMAKVMDNQKFKYFIL